MDTKVEVSGSGVRFQLSAFFSKKVKETEKRLAIGGFRQGTGDRGQARRLLPTRRRHGKRTRSGTQRGQACFFGCARFFPELLTIQGFIVYRGQGEQGEQVDSLSRTFWFRQGTGRCVEIRIDFNRYIPSRPTVALPSTPFYQIIFFHLFAKYFRELPAIG